LFPLSIKDENEETAMATVATNLLEENEMENTAIASMMETNDVITIAKRSGLHAYTVALALSVHSIFEGLALGLEEETSQVGKCVLYSV